MTLNRRILQCGICILALSVVLLSCRIEKRHYTRGYHIEVFSLKSHQALSENHKSALPSCSNSVFVLDSLPELIPAKSVEVSTPMDAAAQPGADVEVSLKNTEIQLQEEIKTSDIASTPGGQQQPNTITSQVHPAAAGSLLFGILSALCFVGLFITSFSPLALVLGLIAGLFLFAILAKWLSKRAFEDMYHARSRYSGRGLAAAGLALSVITVVAFLGLLAVILFGIGFASLA